MNNDQRIITVVSLSLLACFGCQRSVAGAAAAKSVTLTNGIRVVAVHFPGSTNEAIFTYLPMSLTSDGPRQSQWAHLVEHLVIRSTVPVNSPMANAETLPDHMRLDFYGHTGNWKEGVRHTADWLRGVPFAQRNLDAEKPKAKSECDFTVRNFATHKFAMAAWAQGFRHEQKHAALKGDVDRATLAEIQTCRDERLVVLSNVVVCAVGGIEPAKLLPVLEEKLGAIQSRARPAPPVKTHPGDRDMTWDLKARHLVLTWPIPDADGADYPALMIAAQWLTMQFFSDEELKKLTGMVIAGADLVTPEGNFFYVSASLRPGASFEAVLEIIDRHLRQLAAGKGDSSLLPIIGKQMAESLTLLADLSAMKSQLPPNVSPAMLEMNLGLQWGMNEFRYGAHKAALAQTLATVEAAGVAKAMVQHLTDAKRTRLTLKSSATVR